MTGTQNSEAEVVERLRISEIFYSLQGETNTVGLPTVFIRLTGCPLRCGYCDTSYAFQGGEWQVLDSIMRQVKSYQGRYVTVTGGEPLAQKTCARLLAQLCDQGYQVSLETSGSLSIAGLDPRVSVVMDLKTPSSGECERNLYDNIALLKQGDQVKFVISNKQDFRWSAEQLARYKLEDRCEVLFSPVHEEQDPAQLAQWILDENLPVRFQIQLHKILWGDRAGV
ncbi:MAG TPA: 7-carboxy-7-deazaguanine synthase QueE [Gammaproteobacteria bacterium]|nr:7-carboxy-7-deazaguanine synthase QueE [Gammaproteobacteria bacterium]